MKTYDLIINTRTKHTSLQVKESFAYGAEYFTTPLAIFKLMTEVFHLHQMSDEYVYMLPMLLHQSFAVVKLLVCVVLFINGTSSLFFRYFPDRGGYGEPYPVF